MRIRSTEIISLRIKFQWRTDLFVENIFFSSAIEITICVCVDCCCCELLLLLFSYNIVIDHRTAGRSVPFVISISECLRRCGGRSLHWLHTDWPIDCNTNYFDEPIYFTFITISCVIHLNFKWNEYLFGIFIEAKTVKTTHSFFSHRRHACSI